MTDSAFLHHHATRLLELLGAPTTERWEDDPDALLWWNRAEDQLRRLTDEELVAAVLSEPQLLTAKPDNVSTSPIEALRENLLGLLEPLVGGT